MEAGKKMTLWMTLSEASTSPKRTRSVDSGDWPPSPQHVLHDFDDRPDGLHPLGPTVTQTWPVCSGEMRSLSLYEAG